jgi:hypothetical protein
VPSDQVSSQFHFELKQTGVIMNETGHAVLRTNAMLPLQFFSMPRKYDMMEYANHMPKRFHPCPPDEKSESEAISSVVSFHPCCMFSVLMFYLMCLMFSFICVYATRI